MSQYAEHKTEASVIAALAALSAVSTLNVRQMGAGKPFVLAPGLQGQTNVIDLSKFEGPRKAAEASFSEAASFIDYINIFKDPASRLFCSLSQRAFYAILDYHDPEEDTGRHCEHTAKFHLALTPKMEAWQRITQRAITQQEFIDFLEDRVEDITEPAGADVLLLAKTLELIDNVAFKSVQRNSDGGFDLTYEKTTTAKVGQADVVEVPSKFLVQIPIFQGGDPVSLPVRLRYKLVDSQVRFGLSFIRLDDLLQNEVQAVRERIAEATGHPVWAGTSSTGSDDTPF